MRLFLAIAAIFAFSCECVNSISSAPVLSDATGGAAASVSSILTATDPWQYPEVLTMTTSDYAQNSVSSSLGQATSPTPFVLPLVFISDTTLASFRIASATITTSPPTSGMTVAPIIPFSLSTTHAFPPTANATITLYPKVPEFVSIFNWTVVTTICEPSQAGVLPFIWAFDAVTSCFSEVVAQSAQPEISTTTTEPVAVTSSFPPNNVGFPLMETTEASTMSPSLTAQISLPPLSVLSVSYVEYLASFVSSVAVNNVPTSSVDVLLLSKISIWTVGLVSQSSTTLS